MDNPVYIPYAANMIGVCIKEKHFESVVGVACQAPFTSVHAEEISF